MTDAKGAAASVVDLPGYGFAKLAQSEQERIGAFIERYLDLRPQLRGGVKGGVPEIRTTLPRPRGVTPVEEPPAQWTPVEEPPAQVFLVDSRRAPNDEDAQLFGELRRRGLRTVLVATKMDKLKNSEEWVGRV